MVPRTIPYPRPAEETAIVLQDALSADQVNGSAAGNRATPLPVRDLPLMQETRVFAILELPAGANPWDCGHLTNVKEVLGYSLLEWFLPLKQSPCARHADPESRFKLGPVVGKAIRDAGLIEGVEVVGENEDPDRMGRKKKRRRRSRISAAGEGGGSGAERRHRDRRRRRDREQEESRSRSRSREGI